MSKISLTLLSQQAAAVNSCIDAVSNVCLNKYGEEREESEELRNNWDVLYTNILEIKETLENVLGDIEK